MPKGSARALCQNVQGDSLSSQIATDGVKQDTSRTLQKLRYSMPPISTSHSMKIYGYTCTHSHRVGELQPQHSLCCVAGVKAFRA